VVGSRIARVIGLTFLAFSLGGCDLGDKSTHANKTDSSLCDFYAGSCVQNSLNGDISLSLEPAGAPSEKPLKFRLKSQSPIKLLSARLEGRDMFMGVIPVKFEKSDEKHYEATATYGSCSSGYMVWRLWLNLETDKGQNQSLWFDFLADAEPQ